MPRGHEYPQRSFEVKQAATQLTGAFRKLFPSDAARKRQPYASIRQDLGMVTNRFPGLADDVTDLGSSVSTAMGCFDPAEVPDAEMRTKYRAVYNEGLRQFAGVTDVTTRELLAHLFLRNLVFDITGTLRELPTEEAMGLEALRMLTALGSGTERPSSKDLKRLSLSTVIERALDRKLLPAAELPPIPVERQTSPAINPVLFMFNAIIGNDPTVNAIGTSQSQETEYQKQFGLWRKNLHPVTVQLIGYAQEQMEQAGVSVARRLQGDRDTLIGQRLLDEMIVAAANDLPEQQQMAQMFMIIGNSGVTDPRILAKPARNNVQAMALATALDGLDQMCKVLDSSPTMLGIHSLLFTSEPGHEQAGAAINEQLGSEVFRTMQKAILIGVSGLEYIQAQGESRKPDEHKIALGRLLWEHQVLQAGVAAATQDLKVILDRVNVSGTAKYQLGLDNQVNNQVEPPTISQRLLVFRRDVTALN